MKIRGLMFKTEMSRAADNGTKTVTRRKSHSWLKYLKGDLLYEKAGMFGSRKKAKNWFEITKDVYLERVMEISEEDAEAEGVEPADRSFRIGFKKIWIEINGDSSWEENPLVSVINFRKITKQEAMEKLGGEG